MIAPMGSGNGPLSPDRNDVEPVWRYSFVLQRSAGAICSDVAREVINGSMCRFEVAAVEDDFKRLRAELYMLGFEMFEIERVPYWQAESVQ